MLDMLFKLRPVAIELKLSCCSEDYMHMKGSKARVRTPAGACEKVASHLGLGGGFAG